MAIPGQTFSIPDPGLGTINPANTIPLFYGPAAAGTNDVLVTINSINALKNAFDKGPMVEAAARCLAIAGGPIRCMKAATSVAAANGTVTASRFSGSSTGTVAVAGSANDDYEVHLKITKTGTLGAGKFQYSLDDGRTFTEAITIPTGGTYVIPGSGLTLTFTAGAGPTFFELGDLFEFDSTAAMWNTADLATAITALTADNTEWDFMVCCGKHGTATAANAIWAALETHLTTFFNAFRFVGAMIDGGSDDEATTIAAFTGTSKRAMVVYGDCDRTAANPYPGFGAPKRPWLDTVAARATASLISTDLGRVANGSEPSILSISHDEYKTENMDAEGFTTARTYPGLPNQFFITHGRMKAPVGSDFTFWQYRRIMDEACKLAYAAQLLYLNSGVRVLLDGTGRIDERDASRIESAIQAKLNALLLEPKNAEGTQGHVSGAVYTVLRSNNVLATNQLITEVSIVPLSYAKFFSTTLGFTNVLPTAEAA